MARRARTAAFSVSAPFAGAQGAASARVPALPCSGDAGPRRAWRCRAPRADACLLVAFHSGDLTCGCTYTTTCRLAGTMAAFKHPLWRAMPGDFNSLYDCLVLLLNPTDARGPLSGMQFRMAVLQFALMHRDLVHRHLVATEGLSADTVIQQLANRGFMAIAGLRVVTLMLPHVSFDVFVQNEPGPPRHYGTGAIVYKLCYDQIFINWLSMPAAVSYDAAQDTCVQLPNISPSLRPEAAAPLVVDADLDHSLAASVEEPPPQSAAALAAADDAILATASVAAVPIAPAPEAVVIPAAAPVELLLEAALPVALPPLERIACAVEASSVCAAPSDEIDSTRFDYDADFPQQAAKGTSHRAPGKSIPLQPLGRTTSVACHLGGGSGASAQVATARCAAESCFAVHLASDGSFTSPLASSAGKLFEQASTAQHKPPRPKALQRKAAPHKSAPPKPRSTSPSEQHVSAKPAVKCDAAHVISAPGSRFSLLCAVGAEEFSDAEPAGGAGKPRSQKGVSPPVKRSFTTACAPLVSTQCVTSPPQAPATSKPLPSIYKGDSVGDGESKQLAGSGHSAASGESETRNPSDKKAITPPALVSELVSAGVIALRSAASQIVANAIAAAIQSAADDAAAAVRVMEEQAAAKQRAEEAEAPKAKADEVVGDGTSKQLSGSGVESLALSSRAAGALDAGRGGSAASGGGDSRPLSGLEALPETSPPLPGELMVPASTPLTKPPDVLVDESSETPPLALDLELLCADAVADDVFLRAAASHFASPLAWPGALGCDGLAATLHRVLQRLAPLLVKLVLLFWGFGMLPGADAVCGRGGGRGARGRIVAAAAGAVAVALNTRRGGRGRAAPSRPRRGGRGHAADADEERSSGSEYEPGSDGDASGDDAVFAYAVVQEAAIDSAVGEEVAVVSDADEDEAASEPDSDTSSVRESDLDADSGEEEENDDDEEEVLGDTDEPASTPSPAAGNETAPPLMVPPDALADLLKEEAAADSNNNTPTCEACSTFRDFMQLPEEKRPASFPGHPGGAAPIPSLSESAKDCEANMEEMGYKVADHRPASTYMPTAAALCIQLIVLMSWTPNGAPSHTADRRCNTIQILRRMMPDLHAICAVMDFVQYYFDWRLCIADNTSFNTGLWQQLLLERLVKVIGNQPTVLVVSSAKTQQHVEAIIGDVRLDLTKKLVRRMDITAERMASFGIEGFNGFDPKAFRVQLVTLTGSKTPILLLYTNHGQIVNYPTTAEARVFGLELALTLSAAVATRTPRAMKMTVVDEHVAHRKLLSELAAGTKTVTTIQEALYIAHLLLDNVLHRDSLGANPAFTPQKLYARVLRSFVKTLQDFAAVVCPAPHGTGALTDKQQILDTVNWFFGITNLLKDGYRLFRNVEWTIPRRQLAPALWAMVTDSTDKDKSCMELYCSAVEALACAFAFFDVPYLDGDDLPNKKVLIQVFRGDLDASDIVRLDLRTMLGRSGAAVRDSMVRSLDPAKVTEKQNWFDLLCRILNTECKSVADVRVLLLLQRALLRITWKTHAAATGLPIGLLQRLAAGTARQFTEQDCVRLGVILQLPGHRDNGLQDFLASYKSNTLAERTARYNDNKLAAVSALDALIAAGPNDTPAAAAFIAALVAMLGWRATAAVAGVQSKRLGIGRSSLTEYGMRRVWARREALRTLVDSSFETFQANLKQAAAEAKSAALTDRYTTGQEPARTALNALIAAGPNDMPAAAAFITALVAMLGLNRTAALVGVSHKTLGLGGGSLVEYGIGRVWARREALRTLVDSSFETFQANFKEAAAEAKAATRTDRFTTGQEPALIALNALIAAGISRQRVEAVSTALVAMLGVHRTCAVVGVHHTTLGLCGGSLTQHGINRIWTRRKELRTLLRGSFEDFQANYKLAATEAKAGTRAARYTDNQQAALQALAALAAYEAVASPQLEQLRALVNVALPALVCATSLECIARLVDAHECSLGLISDMLLTPRAFSLFLGRRAALQQLFELDYSGFMAALDAAEVAAKRAASTPCLHPLLQRIALKSANEVITAAEQEQRGDAFAALQAVRRALFTGKKKEKEGMISAPSLIAKLNSVFGSAWFCANNLGLTKRAIFTEPAFLKRLFAALHVLLLEAEQVLLTTNPTTDAANETLLADLDDRLEAAHDAVAAIPMQLAKAAQTAVNTAREVAVDASLVSRKALRLGAISAVRAALATADERYNTAGYPALLKKLDLGEGTPGKLLCKVDDATLFAAMDELLAEKLGDGSAPHSPAGASAPEGGAHAGPPAEANAEAAVQAVDEWLGSAFGLDDDFQPHSAAGAASEPHEAQQERAAFQEPAEQPTAAEFRALRDERDALRAAAVAAETRHADELASVNAARDTVLAAARQTAHAMLASERASIAAMQDVQEAARAAAATHASALAAVTAERDAAHAASAAAAATHASALAAVTAERDAAHAASAAAAATHASALAAVTAERDAARQAAADAEGLLAAARGAARDATQPASELVISQQSAVVRDNVVHVDLPSAAAADAAVAAEQHAAYAAQPASELAVPPNAAVAPDEAVQAGLPATALAAAAAAVPDEQQAADAALDAALTAGTAEEHEEALTAVSVAPMLNTTYMVGLPTGTGTHTRFTEDGTPVQGRSATPAPLRGVPPPTGQLSRFIP